MGFDQPPETTCANQLPVRTISYRPTYAGLLLECGLNRLNALLRLDQRCHWQHAKVACNPQIAHYAKHVCDIVECRGAQQKALRLKHWEDRKGGREIEHVFLASAFAN